jgi:Ca-activated chloride channel family protein
MRIKIALIPMLIILILLIPKSVLADGIIIPEPPICDPSPCHPFPIPISQLEIRYHHVDVKIENQLAVTHVDQVFYNPNDWVIEGIYVFPIPIGAAINEFTMWIDGEPVRGKILDSNEARLMYEKIVREMQDPALLEYISQDSVQIEIFPIQPGGESRIELEYSEVLEAENGLIRYLYPLNTEKFSTQPLNDVYVNVNLTSDAPIRAAYSPSHSVDVNMDD